MAGNLYELTNPQMNIWYTNEYFKELPINNICGSIFINETVDFSILKKALLIYLNYNDNFKLRFHNIDGKISQSFADNIIYNPETLNLNDEKDVKKTATKMVNTPFNIYDLNLFDFKIFKLPSGNGGLIGNIHHLIADAATFSILTNEIVYIYSKLVKKESPALVRFSYKDYITSENEYLSSDRFKKDEKYWENELTPIPDVATVPVFNEQKKDINSLKSNRKEFNIKPDLLKKIKKYCSDNNLSIFNFLISIYSLYIGRINHMEKFLIGTPILNRTTFAEKHTSGMFISTSLLKIDISNNLSFNDFIKQNAKNSFSMLRHQKYNYNYIIENVRKKDNTISNLYDIIISYQITKATNKKLNVSYSSNWYATNYMTNTLSIHFHDLDDTGNLMIDYDYQIAKLSELDINDMHARIMYIIEQVLNKKDILINDVEIVTPNEKSKILYEFNNTEYKYNKNKTIVGMFEEQVRKTPNNIALVFENQKLTYDELNKKANSLAHYLRNNMNIKPNDLIGIMVNRSLEMIIAILAVLKAGGAYIPIDPTYPEDRIKYMLENSSAKLLLTQNHLKNKVAFKSNVLIDLANNNIYNLSFKNLEHINEPDDLSYVIFTSGSTGKPKGVMLTQKALSNLTNYCNHYVEYLKAPSNLAVVSITTVSFDIFIFETLISLQRGLKLIIANENEQNSPTLLNELIEKNDIKIIQSTPSRMQILLNNVNKIPFFKNLDYFTLAGEQLPLHLVQNLKKLCNATIYNGYGPSETTVFSTLTKMNSSIITIGKPLDNTQIYILDKNHNVLPRKISGELYIAGDGVGKGYLKNKELTDKSFINNPFVANSIMYKTGDLGYYNENGEIICLGRADNQVKLRGQRIELAEIEETLSNLDYINNTVVVKKIDNNLHEFLCAYYTSKTGSNINVNDLKEHLAKSLPKYMIPSVFMQLDSLPYTPNGKIDRKKLPEPVFEQKNQDIQLTRNEFDDNIISILQNLLKVNNISLNDDFFELGGDSLSAITFSAQIQSKFNVEIYVKDIIEHPIIQDLSDFISKKEHSTEKHHIKSVAKSNYYKVSSAQKRIYYSCEKSGNNNTLYNIPGGIIVTGNIDYKKLENSINKIIERHESLRTYFEIQNNEVVQKILDNVDFKLDVIENADYSNINELYNDFVKPFDLSKAPLLRLKAIKFTNNKTAIFIDMHHIISDGASLSIFVNELNRLYNDKTLKPLSYTYKDFSAYENEILNSSEFKEAENYWLNEFKGEIPILNMPTNHSRPTIPDYKGQTFYATIDAETTKKIHQLSNDLCITPYMFLLSCYYVLLYKYTSQEDIIVGTPVVGRNSVETSNIIGMFVNTLALRNKIDSNMPFRDLLVDVKNNMLNAYRYQTYPFDELLKILKIHRDTSRNPLFDTMFIYQNNGFKAPTFKNLETETYMPDTKISKFDLSIEAIPVNNKINLSFEYATSLFNKDFIKQLSKHYLNIINHVLTNVDTKIKNIEILSEYQKNKILYNFNNTSSPDYPKDKTIIELFEEQVLKTPAKTAVVFENKKITYKELNEKANSLANYLISKGIKNEDTVAIKLNRSFELIIAIYATIKTGASYVLIDYAFPQERINYIISTSKAKFIITKDSNLELDSIININNFNFSKYNTENLKNARNDNLCIIYTSGSTGRPKGVSLNSSGFVNLIYAFDKEMNISNYKNILGIANVTFDMFAVELFSSTLFGNTLVLANEDEQKNPISISKLIKDNKVEFLVTTPSRMELLLSEECEGSLEYLKAFQLGGEKFTSQLYKKLIQHTKANIYNGYGPTEITACCTNKLVDSSNVTIGKPIQNVQAYICDSNMNLLPIGVIGEICIGGVGVSSGYINNKEATNKSFVNNPYGNGMLYKTGDYGKFNSDGEIEYLGRIDNQIKIHGLRIELKEIEEAILKYPDIEKTIVVKQTLNNRDFLTAYFTSNQKIDLAHIRNHLSNQLPLYMIPSFFIQVDSFNYTASGKLDQKSLPMPSENRAYSDTYVSPKTNLEKQLVKIWENILDIKPIGINDNFFELGGDSLLAMSLNLELLKIAPNIKYSDIFQYPTIAKLEEKVNLHNDNLIFSKIQNIPESIVPILNSAQKKSKINKTKLKNVLLMGSTGFLGIHILEQLLLNENGKIYCIIREGSNSSPKEKLLSKLNYYFGNKYDKLVDDRIIVIKGDTCKHNFGITIKELNKLAEEIDVVINSAAIVAHYGIYEDFYKSNVLSIKYLIEFCKNYTKKLYHISTTSISGDGLDFSLLHSNSKKKDITLNETKLYVGQIVDNFYMRSKFEAETLLLTAISSGLDAYILRMGNLMPRLSDGKFQNNILSNAFINKILTFIKIKAVPINLIYTNLEFTPVDSASQAIYNILTNSSSNNRIFHLYNHHTVRASYLLRLFKKNGIYIKICSNSEFKRIIKDILANEKTMKLLQNILDDFDKDYNINYKHDIKIKSSISKRYLTKTRFKWPKITNKYLYNFIDLIKEVL